MADVNTYILVMEEFCKLRLQEKKEQEERDNMIVQSFSELCDELHLLYQKEKEKICHKYIIPFINKHPFLGEISSLHVINKLKFEPYHSLFLKYIWDSQTKSGSIFFTNFLEEIGINAPWIHTVKQNLYRTECEYFTGKQRKRDLNNKRIDLLFVDEINKWLIVIENKINSEVRSDSKSNRYQLDVYRDYCERKFQDYHKVFILLSYNRNNALYIETCPSWQYVDYYQVFKCLLKYNSQDAIINDYLKTLFELLFPDVILEWKVNASLYRTILFYNRVISKIQ